MGRGLHSMHVGFCGHLKIEMQATIWASVSVSTWEVFLQVCHPVHQTLVYLLFFFIWKCCPLLCIQLLNPACWGCPSLYWIHLIDSKTGALGRRTCKLYIPMHLFAAWKQLQVLWGSTVSKWYISTCSCCQIFWTTCLYSANPISSCCSVCMWPHLRKNGVYHIIHNINTWCNTRISRPAKNES